MSGPLLATERLPKRVRVEVRDDPEEIAHWKAAAGNTGQTLAGWARNILRQAAAKAARKAAKAEASQEAWKKIYDVLQARVAAAVLERRGQGAVVQFSAFSSKAPTDNLDEVAVRGRVKFQTAYDPFWERISREDCGTLDDPKPGFRIIHGVAPPDVRADPTPGHDYASEVIEDPTWLDVAVLADDMIRTVKDYHHVHLEAVRPGCASGDPEGPYTIYTFSMGS